MRRRFPAFPPGRGIGIIDTLHLIEMPRAIEVDGKIARVSAGSSGRVETMVREITSTG